LNHLRLLLLQKCLGWLGRFIELCVFQIHLSVTQPVIFSGMISDGGTIEICAQRAFGRIETPAGMEKPEKTLLCYVFGSGG
jgi:hypothetical protein